MSDGTLPAGRDRVVGRPSIRQRRRRLLPIWRRLVVAVDLDGEVRPAPAALSVPVVDRRRRRRGRRRRGERRERLVGAEATRCRTLRLKLRIYKLFEKSDSIKTHF